jgi:predicted CoA-substrate-specific enzyme activase
MIVAGIDVGSKNIHIVVLRDGDVATRIAVASGFDQEEAATAGLAAAAAAVGVNVDGLDSIVATGVGRKAMPFARFVVTEVTADAKGAHALWPAARTVIDVGADEARAIRIDADGRVTDFAVNEKCAAGAGAFVEAMSRALEVDLEEFGRLSTESTESIPMNAQCTVFAESEVVSLIHSNTPRKDIAKAVHDAMAGRVSAMVRRAGVEEAVVIGGGAAFNIGFVKALKQTLGLSELTVAPSPDYLGAYGAALVAAEKAAGSAAAAAAARTADAGAALRESPDPAATAAA